MGQKPQSVVSAPLVGESGLGAGDEGGGSETGSGIGEEVLLDTPRRINLIHGAGGPGAGGGVLLLLEPVERFLESRFGAGDAGLTGGIGSPSGGVGIGIGRANRSGVWHPGAKRRGGPTAIGGLGLPELAEDGGRRFGVFHGAEGEPGEAVVERLAGKIGLEEGLQGGDAGGRLGGVGGEGKLGEGGAVEVGHFGFDGVEGVIEPGPGALGGAGGDLVVPEALEGGGVGGGEGGGGVTALEGEGEQVQDGFGSGVIEHGEGRMGGEPGFDAVDEFLFAGTGRGFGEKAPGNEVGQTGVAGYAGATGFLGGFPSGPLLLARLEVIERFLAVPGGGGEGKEQEKGEKAGHRRYGSFFLGQLAS